MFKIFRSRKHALDIPSFNGDSLIDENEDSSISTKIKQGTAGQVMCGVFQEYCSNSTIHGTKYLGEPHRHWLEKTWWIFAFCTSLLVCGYLIQQVYIKWDQSPVIVSFSEKSTPIYEIPFPAVTICPQTKAKKTMLNFTKVYHEMVSAQHPPYNISDQELKYMEAVAQICDPHLTDSFEIGKNFTSNNIIDTLKDVAPTLNETMMLCKFRNELGYCSDYFQEIMTDEGLCFTFNMLSPRELYREEISKDFFISQHKVASKWNLDTGYEKSAEIEPKIYPYRVFGAGARVGLFVLLRLYEQHLEYICRGPVQGFKILLHEPGEVPQVKKEYFQVPLLQDVLVSVKPNMITTSKGLLNYNPDRRQCYFDSERYLRFFKIYTQRNCELECLANFTMKHCGCVTFSMPRNDETPICGASKITCYDKAEDDLLQKQYVDGLTADDQTNAGKCNCLPACTSLRYDAEVSQSPYDFIRLFEAFRTPISEYPGMQPARLAIFFRDNQFITSKRSELYGQTDFLANCGGLLGLMMGVSLLSIVEIIYHLTLRLCCNLRKRVAHQTRNNVSIKPLSGNTLPLQATN